MRSLTENGKQRVRCVPVIIGAAIGGVVFVSGASMTACQDVSSERTERASARITNGEPDEGHEAVVALFGASGMVTCTGTLIAPRVVLTAAHCVSVVPSRVAFGSDPAAPLAVRRVIGARAHPNFDRVTFTNDVALLLVEPAPSGIVPAVVHGAPPAIDDTVVVVGFGKTSVEGLAPSRKRQGWARVTQVNEDTFTYVADPSQACGGDSGGPVFTRVASDDRLVGVTSRGDSDCSAYGKNVRVERYLESFITPYVLSSEPGTAPDGARCFYPDHCRSGVVCLAAEDDARLSFCSPSCRESACPERMTCGEDGLCRYPVPSDGALGSTCRAASDCFDGLCAGGDPRGPICTVRCLPGAPERCPRDFECRSEPSGPASYACFPPAEPAGGGGCSIVAGTTRSPREPLALAFIALLGLRARARRSRRRCATAPHSRARP